MRTGPLSRQAAPPAPLLGPAELEQLREIALRRRSRRYRTFPAAAGTGPRPTHWHGQGMELHDARPYQPGDDIRHLDWRATARSGKPVSKLFVEERARALFLLIDRRPSMMFGTRRELKAATAARVAAILAFSALAEREPVSGVVLDERGGRYFPPTRTIDGVLSLLLAAAAAPQLPRHGAASPAPAVVADVLPGLLATGTTCCLISDFETVLAGDADLADLLPHQTAAQAAERVALRITDIAERRLPNAGVLRLAAPGGGASALIDTGDPELRRRLRAAILERDRRLRDACRRHGVTLLEIHNDADLPAQLDALL